MKTATVVFGEVAFNVALSLVRFRNGGNWSFFFCGCGRHAKTLRLLDGRLRCRNCCKASGLRYRVELIPTGQRAAYHCAEDHRAAQQRQAGSSSSEAWPEARPAAKPRVCIEEVDDRQS
jgi:hypothetical protein